MNTTLVVDLNVQEDGGVLVDVCNPVGVEPVGRRGWAVGDIGDVRRREAAAARRAGGAGEGARGGAGITFLEMSRVLGGGRRLKLRSRALLPLVARAVGHLVVDG